MNTVTRIAVERAGGSRAVAREFGITRQAVEQWEHCPAKHVRSLERLSGVPASELRPDIFGDPPKGRPHASPRQVA